MQYDSILIVKDIVIAVAAFVGMGMGLLNFWNEKAKEKVKLKVIPKAVKAAGKSVEGKEFILTTQNEFIGKNSKDLFAIEVINLSKFPVVIEEVGFVSKKNKKERMYIPDPLLNGAGDWPKKLESREAITLYGKLSGILSSNMSSSLFGAFALTACGHKEVGNSEALKQLIEFSKNTPYKAIK